MHHQTRPTYNLFQVKSIPRDTIRENFNRKRIGGLVSLIIITITLQVNQLKKILLLRVIVVQYYLRSLYKNRTF
ncbi:MAG: hypothetical protein ACFFB1_00700 [Promethearchaeota archaeon]